MGLQEAFIEKLAKDALKQLKPEVVFGLIKEHADDLLDKLQEDKNHNGIKDGVEVAGKLGIVAKELGEICELLK